MFRPEPGVLCEFAIVVRSLWCCRVLRHHHSLAMAGLYRHYHHPSSDRALQVHRSIDPSFLVEGGHITSRPWEDRHFLLFEGSLAGVASSFCRVEGIGCRGTSPPSDRGSTSVSDTYRLVYTGRASVSLSEFEHMLSCSRVDGLSCVEAYCSTRAL